MAEFADSYVGRLRRRVGHELILVPGAQVVLVRDDGRILVQRRTDSGRWEIPAGAAEPGQSFRDVAVAEVAEETGIRLPVEDLVPFASFSDPVGHLLTYPNGDQVHAFALCFWARVGAEEPSATSEATDHRWVRPEDLPEPTHAPTARVVSLYLEHLATGRFIAA